MVPYLSSSKRPKHRPLLALNAVGLVHPAASTFGGVKESIAIAPNRPNAATNANITIAAFVFILIFSRAQII